MTDKGINEFGKKCTLLSGLARVIIFSYFLNKSMNTEYVVAAAEGLIHTLLVSLVASTKSVRKRSKKPSRVI